MVNYNQSTIYKLCCNDLDIKEIYIGSTTNFNKRKNCHKSLCNNEKSKDHNLYVYQFIRDHGGFQNWSMVEMELFNARDKKNLIRRERYWIETEKASLNSNRSYITAEERKEYNAEYCAKNTDKIKEYIAEYRTKNVDKIKEKVTCECGSIISKGNLSHHKKTKKHIKFLEQQPSTL